MLRLRKSILWHVLSSRLPPCTATLFSPHSLRLLSTAVPFNAAAPFALEDYLVATCVLSRSQAFKASSKISHLKSPSKPDAVLAFLRGRGMSSADIAALVAKDPQFLCADVDRTLSPNVADLTNLGLSRPQIAQLILQAHLACRCRSITSKLQYFLPLFGSWENFLLALKRTPYLIGFNIEKVVNPSLALLRECGLNDSEISKLCLAAPWFLGVSTNRERMQAMVACAEGLGVPRGFPMFRHALRVVSSLSEANVSTKVGYLKTMFRWSDEEVAIAVSRLPAVLGKSKDMLQRTSEFLISKVGLEPTYIAHRPVLLALSLEGRLRPRHYVVKFLNANGLLKHDSRFVTTMKLTEKVFKEKFILPHREAAPLLAEDYAASCRGEACARLGIL